jgi:Ran GTPase-activating protein (RanGAP) involved in mRNA processing and transport
MIYRCKVPNIVKWDEPEQIKSILDELEENKDKIVGLELCHNSIGEKCAEVLGTKIKNLKNLRLIDLSDCFVSRGSEELPKCLKFLLEGIIDKPIIELKLSDNALGPTAAPGYEFFFEKNKTLEKLYMDNCGMGPIGTPRLMKILKENKDMPLKVLKFSRNKMENVGCSSISELIKEKKTLKEIKICDNEINKEGLNDFLNAIKDNENISWLDIHNNILTNKIKNIHEIIGSLSNIIHLNLSDLTIEDKDIIKNIFETLTKLTKLREFYFAYNISDVDLENKSEFISQLLNCLLQVDNLKEIHLESNDIPKSLYNKYLPEFKKKGVYLFSCYDEEEELDDEDNEEIDMTDLNK